MELKTDSDLYAIIKMQPVFGKYSNLAWAYVELFGVVPMSKHAAKIRSILDVLKMVFQAEAFTFNKKRYSISHAGVAEALNIVVMKNFQERLENHNYLKKVMIGISEKEERESGKQSERDLRGREARMMSGHRDEQSSFSENEDPGRYPVSEESVAPPPVRLKSVPPAELTPEQIAENKRRIRALAESIGQKGES